MRRGDVVDVDWPFSDRAGSAPEAVMGRVFDVCLLRAYENGKPARVDHYLRWAMDEPKVGDLVLAAGFPGQTSRFVLPAHLEATFGTSYYLNLKAQGRAETVVADFLAVELKESSLRLRPELPSS